MPCLSVCGHLHGMRPLGESRWVSEGGLHVAQYISEGELLAAKEWNGERNRFCPGLA